MTASVIDRLSEQPFPTSLLWRLYWGPSILFEPPEGDRSDDFDRPCAMVDNIFLQITRASQSQTVLIDGSYGSGKTSFMRVVQKYFCKRHIIGEDSDGIPTRRDDNTEDGDDQNTRSSDREKNNPDTSQESIHIIDGLWLHMPVLTGNIDASAGTVVAAKIARHVMDQLIEARPDSPQGSGPCPTDLPIDTHITRLRRSVEDLWRLERMQTINGDGQPQHPFPNSEKERPRQNGAGLAGSAYPSEDEVAARAVSANEVEQHIDNAIQCLTNIEKVRRDSRASDKTESPEIKRSLVVFVDDLDRCENHVPQQIVRLLLRFGATRHVHFVIACDKDILTDGAFEWMKQSGKARDKDRTVVTARSALEKYIHIFVEIPSLCEPVRLTSIKGVFTIGKEFATLIREKKIPIPVRSIFRERPHTERIGDLEYYLFDFFLTWLLANLKKSDLIKSRDSESRNPESEDDNPKNGYSVVRHPGGVYAPSSDSALGGAANNGTDESNDNNSDETNNDESIKQIEVTNGQIEVTKFDDIMPSSTPIMIAISESMQCVPFGASYILEATSRYKEIFGYITPRQFKSMLRNMLFKSKASQSRESVEEDFLKRLFYGFWILRQEDPDLYRVIRSIAKSVLETDNDNGRYFGGSDLAAWQSDLFFRLLQAMADYSPQISKLDLIKYWPTKTKEKAFLIRLISLVDSNNDNKAFYDPTRRRSDLSSTRGIYTQYDHEEMKIDDNQTLASGDPVFADWFESQFGAILDGSSVNEQVSNFEDQILLIRRLKGAGEASRYIATYVEQFLPHHEPYFGASIAASLSNLAVIIDDQQGLEQACDRLFTAAGNVNQSHPAIYLYHAEFLLDVIGNENRLRLLAGIKQADDKTAIGDKKKEYREQVSSLFESYKKKGGDPGDIYPTFLKARLKLILGTETQNAEQTSQKKDREQAATDSSESEQKSVTEPEDPYETIATSVDGLMGSLISSATKGEFAPFARLDATLDRIFGLGNAAKFPLKAGVFARIWKRLEETASQSQQQNSMETATVPIRTFVANMYVGESDANSGPERVGLRLNRGLLMNPAAYPAAERRWIGAIWSQSTAILARYGTRDQSQQPVVAFGLMIARDIYGDEPGRWAPRATRAMSQVGYQGAPTLALLTKDLRQIYDALHNDRFSAETAAKAVSALFEGKVDKPITRFTEFKAVAELRSGWDEDFSKKDSSQTGSASNQESKDHNKSAKNSDKDAD